MFFGGVPQAREEVGYWGVRWTGRWNGLSQVIKMVRLSGVAGIEPLIGQVGYRLSCSSEDWGTVFPTHGQDEWERYERFFAGQSGKDDT